MILIITNKFDLSACDVIDYLKYNNLKYIIISSNDLIKIYTVDDDGDVKFSIDGSNVYCTKKISAVWYRRGSIKGKFCDFIEETNNSSINSLLSNFSESENNELIEYFKLKLESKKHLGSIFSKEVNKLNMLFKAKEVGFKIPKSFVISDKSILDNFHKQNNRELITKTVMPGLIGRTKKSIVYG